MSLTLIADSGSNLARFAISKACQHSDSAATSPKMQRQYLREGAQFARRIQRADNPSLTLDRLYDALDNVGELEAKVANINPNGCCVLSQRTSRIHSQRCHEAR